MHTTINSMLMIDGQLLSDGTVSSDVIQGTITSMCGIQTLEMGAFGGILVGLGVSFLHNRYYKIEFPDVFLFLDEHGFVTNYFHISIYYSWYNNVLYLANYPK